MSIFEQMLVRQQLPVPKGKRGVPVNNAHYVMLGIDVNATSTEIKVAFRKLSIQHHPDKNQGRDETYKALSAAYKVLVDPVLRICYDSFGPDFETLPQLELFKQSLKHPDIVVQVDATLEQCVNGHSMKVAYNRLDSRGSPEKFLHVFQLSPGVRQNQKITFVGSGHLEDSKIRGNLVLVVNQLPHPEFQRVVDILIYKKQLSLSEAITGQCKIQHPNKTEFIVELKDGLQTDKWYCCAGQGVTRDAPMFVSFIVKFPELSVTQRQTIVSTLIDDSKSDETNEEGVLRYFPEVYSAEDVDKAIKMAQQEEPGQCQVQ